MRRTGCVDRQDQVRSRYTSSVGTSIVGGVLAEVGQSGRHYGHVPQADAAATFQLSRRSSWRASTSATGTTTTSSRVGRATAPAGSVAVSLLGCVPLMR